jgi:hypothetical protein
MLPYPFLDIDSFGKTLLCYGINLNSFGKKITWAVHKYSGIHIFMPVFNYSTFEHDKNFEGSVSIYPKSMISMWDLYAHLHSRLRSHSCIREYHLKN